MRLALALLLLLAGDVTESAVVETGGGMPPCRPGSALSPRGECVEHEASTQVSAASDSSPTEVGGRVPPSAADVSTAGGAGSEAEQHQQLGRRPQGRRRDRGGGRRRGSQRRRKLRRHQQVKDAPGPLKAPTKGSRRRRPCRKGYIRHKPRGRCFKRRFAYPNATDYPQDHTSGRRRAFPMSGSTSSPRGRRRCPGGYLRHSGGRCFRPGSGSRPAAGSVPKPGPLRDGREQCSGGRVAWEDGRCVPLATLRSCPEDSFRLKSGICIRCRVSDKEAESCPAGCAVDEQKAKCICCQPNGDDP